jgi:hypothetical protein
MPAPARARSKLIENPLEACFTDLVRIMKRHSPPFRTDVPCMSAGKKSFQLTVPKPVAIPDAYGGKPVDLAMASAILQKDFVGFYLMCIYTNEAMKEKLSPALLKLLKGKTCFHIGKLDDNLRKDIEAALRLGTHTYHDRGWV